MGDVHVLIRTCFPNSGLHSAAGSASPEVEAARVPCPCSPLLSLLQAFLFPKLLDGEFTRFEFPRRLKGDDVGQKVLYRDYFMEGW